MALNVEESNKVLESKFIGLEYSPITAKIICDSLKDSYGVIFASKEGVVRHSERGLTPKESLDLADGGTAHLKGKGYACIVDLTALPDEFKKDPLIRIKDAV